MNSAFFTDASLLLTTAAKDFQRTVDQQIASFTKEMEMHQRTMDELNKKINSIKETLSELEAKQQTKQNHLESSIEEIDAIQKEIDSLKLEETRLKDEKQKVQIEFDEKRRKIDTASFDIQKRDQDDRETKELTDGLLFYSNRLQMFFNKDREGIRISFRCIDRKHPKRRFYVIVKLNDENKWEGVVTKPLLSSIDDLISVLNTTNDMNSFIRHVRQRFQREYCSE